MSEKFLKLIRSDYTEWLIGKHPWAYLLLNLIALRACRSLPNPKGLKFGEALIGDWKAIGATRGQYRHALLVLQHERIIEIIETNRTRAQTQPQHNQKTTTGTTTAGTKVKLLNSIVWDINSEMNNHRNNHPTTNEQPLNNHEEEVKIDISNDISNKELAQPASRLRQKNDGLSFDFEKWEYIGITEKDLMDWALIYPAVDLKIEISKSINWLQSNPSKSKKSLWRKFLTGWLQRANENIENKKAFRSAYGSNLVDRRTKDAQGIPVENQYAGRF